MFCVGSLIKRCCYTRAGARVDFASFKSVVIAANHVVLPCALYWSILILVSEDSGIGFPLDEIIYGGMVEHKGFYILQSTSVKCVEHSSPKALCFCIAVITMMIVIIITTI